MKPMIIILDRREDGTPNITVDKLNELLTSAYEAGVADGKSHGNPIFPGGTNVR